MLPCRDKMPFSAVTAGIASAAFARLGVKARASSAESAAPVAGEMALLSRRDGGPLGLSGSGSV